MEDLQDEVERLLRKLDLEDVRAVAVHLQVNDAEGMGKRELLRGIQNVFDGEENEEARTGLLRALPIPETHRNAYQQLLEPPLVVPDIQDQVNGLPDAPNEQQQNVVNNGVPVVHANVPAAVAVAPVAAGGGDVAAPVPVGGDPRGVAPGFYGPRLHASSGGVVHRIPVHGGAVRGAAPGLAGPRFAVDAGHGVVRYPVAGGPGVDGPRFADGYVHSGQGFPGHYSQVGAVHPAVGVPVRAQNGSVAGSVAGGGQGDYVGPGPTFPGYGASSWVLSSTVSIPCRCIKSV